MSKSGFSGVFIVLIISFFILSCSEFRKVQKSSDWKLKYDAAMKYYEDKDYFKAITLFEEILPIIKGTKEAELAQYYYAYSHFKDKQFILAAHYFKQFYEVYSRSDYAMEAGYMHAYSLYMQSPIFSLDQTPTYESITAMQNFLNKYPYSEYSKNANDIIDELQVKLERKSAANAKHYYKLRRYKSALVAFENFQRDYPDSDYNEEIGYLEMDATYELAQKSISTKQKERYQKTVDLYLKYIDKYPNGEYLKACENLYSSSRDELEKLATNN